MIELPVIDANDQLIECTLDGVPVYVGLSWNQSAERWSISVRNLNREFLVASIAGVPNWPLLRQVRRSDFPPGELMIGLTAGKALDRRSFMDGTAALIYLTAADVEGLRGDA